MAQNLGDETSVKKSSRQNRIDRHQEMVDLAKILESPEGRRFLWRLLDRSKVFGSIWEASARIHYNAGVQDFGHFLMSEITEASQEAFFLMMKENKKREEGEKDNE